ncbi:MAG: hypothetical protein WCJ62_13075 [Flavobacterium sp.]
MKNIHILPTDKPSRLLKSIEKGNLFLSNRVTCGSKWINQNIYIINDEMINKDEWSIANNTVRKFKKFMRYTHCKKIILTTDQELIKDAVQAIDDEFLEWFVAKAKDSGKPIDIVEVKKDTYEEISEDDFFKKVNYYAIIIPIEEPKQHLVDMKNHEDSLWEDEPKQLDIKELNRLDDIEIEELMYDSEVGYYTKEEPKQETLEEAAERLATASPKIFIEGAKWQMDKQDSFTISFVEWLNEIQSFHSGENAYYFQGKWYSYKEILEFYKNMFPR